MGFPESRAGKAGACHAVAASAERAGKPIDRHRDGTIGIYVDDPSGNAVEFICYPPGETVYGNSVQE